MTDKVLLAFADSSLEMVTIDGRSYYIRDGKTGRVLAGGQRFETRREAKAFAENAVKNGYQTLEPIVYNPLSDAPVNDYHMADAATLKARYEAVQRDRYLMSSRGFQDEE